MTAFGSVCDSVHDCAAQAADSDGLTEAVDSELEDVAKTVGQGTDTTPEVLEGTLSALPPR